MSPILVPKLCAIIFPFPKLLKAHKVVLNSKRSLNKNTHPMHYAASHVKTFLKFLKVNIHFMLISKRKVSIPFVADAKIPKF